jgi:hypothetical protein
MEMKAYVVLSLALVIALLACTASPATVVASSANLPPGIYATTITEADIPAEFPPEVVALLVGYWEVEFTESGSYIVYKDGSPVATGRYNSNPARLIMRDLDGVLACTDAPGIATATYRWTLSGNELLLTTVNDGCAGRNLVLTAHPLEKQ